MAICDRLSPRGLTVAKQTWQRFAVRATRLQEQERTAGGLLPVRLGRTCSAGGAGHGLG
jgi:hypothetical protein